MVDLHSQPFNQLPQLEQQWTSQALPRAFARRTLAAQDHVSFLFANLVYNKNNYQNSCGLELHIAKDNCTRTHFVL